MPADDFDERVPGGLQLAEHALDQFIDGPHGIGAEIAARLPAALGDGLGAGIRHVVGDPHVILLRRRDILAFGGGLQIGAHRDRARRMADQRPQIPVSEAGPVPPVAGDAASQVREAPRRRLERRVRARHDAYPFAISFQPSTDSGLRGPGPT